MKTKSFTAEPVGHITACRGKFAVAIDGKYAAALEGLEGFSHVCIVWWADALDCSDIRAAAVLEKPYKKGPDRIGVFATRSPARPNPVCISVCRVRSIDAEKGLIDLYYTDADDGTPVIDIKPFQPSADCVRHPETPQWCAHWPQFIEDSGSFDWSKEFNF